MFQWHCIVLLFLMTVCRMFHSVKIDVSRVTCTAGWIEIEINLLVILNNFLAVIFMYFAIFID